MAFFLIGRVDDTLTLLSPNTFASRQDAMGALSRITAEPGFSLWDAEVLLLDVESGTPILLMRPTIEPAATVLEPEVEADDDVVLVPIDAEAPLESVVVEEPTAESQPASEPVVVDDELAEAEFVPDEPEPTEEVEEFVDDEPEPITLKDALARTAVQMEAEGIVAPDSIAAAEPTESAPESAWPWDTAAEAPESSEAPDMPETPEPSVAAETPLGDDGAFVLSELEEPALDDRSILHATIDDEMFAAARPVIMGSYPGQSTEDEPEADPLESLIDDLVVEPMGVAPRVVPTSKGFAVPVIADAGDFFPVDAAMTVEDAEAAMDPLVEPVGTLQADDASQSSEAPDEVDDGGDISDFILDLGPATETEAPPNTPRDLVDYTCQDCVYEETCPNKDQRLPKDCGSFQWR